MEKFFSRCSRVNIKNKMSVSWPWLTLFHYSALFLLWPCWALQREGGSIGCSWTSNDEKLSEKRFDVSMRQLEKMICSHTEFKVGHLDGGIRPWGVPLIIRGHKPPHLINLNQSGKESSKGSGTSPILFSPLYRTPFCISFPSWQFQSLFAWLSYLIITCPHFGFSPRSQLSLRISLRIKKDSPFFEEKSLGQCWKETLEFKIELRVSCSTLAVKMEQHPNHRFMGM